MSGSHTVAPGETLSGIAEKYDLRLADLIAWNDIPDPNLIHPGQEIELSGHLPAEPGDPSGDGPGDREYIVQTGDTLSEIALAHNTTVEAIQAANDIADPDVITAGQKLIIPSQPS